MLPAHDNFTIKLSNYLRKNNRLEKIIQQFQQDYGLIACIGVEIEFFLSENINLAEFELLLGIKVKKEKGHNQFEIDLLPSTNLIDYINQIVITKSHIKRTAQKLFGNVNFLAKPFLNDYGNAMHFHVNFIEARNININNVTDIKASNFITIIAKSLCHYMLDSFLIFMPNEDDYLRLDKNFMAPTNVSFGGNNRTVAVRIPDQSPTRLEHRIASPSTDPYIAIFVILKSILLGLQSTNNMNNIIKIYGNAFDPQYNLTPLPKSKREAIKLFRLEFFSE